MSTPSLKQALQLLRMEGTQVVELIPGKPIEDADGKLIAMGTNRRQKATFAPIGLKDHQWRHLEDQAAEQLTPGNRAAARRAAAAYYGTEDRARIVLTALITQQDEQEYTK